MLWLLVRDMSLIEWKLVNINREICSSQKEISIIGSFMETFGRTRSSQMNTKTESMGLLGRYIVRSYIEPLLLFFITYHILASTANMMAVPLWPQLPENSL